MINKILNQLNRPGLRWLLFPLISAAYLAKGFGSVNVKFHPAFRAWDFRVRGIHYLSAGPGWAYQYEYLKDLLLKTYFKFFTPKAGDCIIDLGAGLGEETVIFAQEVGKTGSVWSIEANPVTAAALKYACSENKFDQVHVFNIALGAKDEIVEIEDNPDSYVGNTINKEGSANKMFSVKSMPLDRFVHENNITRIDLLKSNIEGAEQFVIQGMERSLSILRVAAISCHDFRHVHHGESEFYATREKIITFFHQHDFEILTDKTGHVVNDDIVYAINRKFYA